MAIFTGCNLIDLYAAESTNNYALNLLKANEPFEGTVVRTFRQGAGRGQRGKHWESEDLSNLTFSVIYYPVFLSVSRQFSLSKAVSLGIADFVKTIVRDENVKIKWPNDLYIGSKKVAGILIENAVSSGRIVSSVIGIGLNVNQTVFSPGIPNPISLKLASGKEADFDLGNCLNYLCTSVEARYMQLKAGHELRIDRDYESMLFGLNDRRQFVINDEPVTGEILGVNDTGKLKLKTGAAVNEYDLHQVVYTF